MAINNTLRAIDSLCANEFAVELDNQRISGIFRIIGLTPYKTDESGQAIKQPFTITKMVQRDPNTPFNKWLRETMEQRGNPSRPLRTLAILAVDDGVETRRWVVKGAWIQEVSYSDFDSASFEMVEESFVIGYDDIEEKWSAL